MSEFDDDKNLNNLWEKAAIAAESEDSSGFVFLLKSLANKGVWQALARIGQVYESGGGNLPRDFEEAVKWYRKAVFECDDPLAHLGLGRSYYDGVGGLSQDRIKAFSHFQKAYLGQMPQAGVYLGIMSYFGIEVKKDKLKAREYFTFAAENDYFLAYAYLARIEFASGHILSGINLAIKSWRVMARLTKADPKDPRLLGVKH